MAPKHAASPRGTKRQDGEHDRSLAASLAKNVYSDVRKAINDHLDNHKEEATTVLRMMQRGLFNGTTKTDEDTLQKSQNKFELTPRYWLTQLLEDCAATHAAPQALVPQALLDHLLGLNKTQLNKVVSFILQVEGKCAVPSRKKGLLFARCIARYEQAGRQLSTLLWSEALRDVDWSSCGVFSFQKQED